MPRFKLPSDLELLLDEAEKEFMNVYKSEM